MFHWRAQEFFHLGESDDLIKAIGDLPLRYSENPPLWEIFSLPVTLAVDARA
jgi:hypothetical protein